MKTRAILKKGAFLLGFSFLLFLLLFAVHPAFTSYAQGGGATPNEPYVIQPGEFDNYTDSEYLYDAETGTEGTESVYDYREHLKTIYNANNEEPPVEDEWILKVIPEKLFINPGEYFYVGRYYGFYLKYEQEYDCYFYYLLKTEFIDGNNDVELPGGNLSIQVEPLAYNYCSYNSETGSTQPYAVNEKYNYMDVSKLFIKDVSMTAQLHNKYHANQGHAPYYTPEEDNGQFFIGTDYRVNGTTRSDSSEYQIKAAKYILGLLGLTSPAVGLLTSAVVTVWDLCEDIPDFIRSAQKDFREDVKLGASNQFLQMDAISKPNQLLAYEGLQKIAAAGVQTSMQEPVLLSPFADNNYARTTFYINETDTWESQLTANIGIDIVRESDDQVYNRVSNCVSTPFRYDYRDGHEPPRELTVNEETTRIGLSEQKDSYTYTPAYNGEHTLRFRGEEGTTARATVKDGDTVLYQQQEYCETFDLSEIKLTAGREYTVEIETVSDKFTTVYRLGMDFTPPDLSIGDTTVPILSDDYQYFSFTGEAHLYYRFTASDPSAVLEVYDSGFGLIKRSEGNSMVLPLLGEVKFYVKVVFPQQVSKDITVSVADERRIAFNSTGGEALPGMIVSSGVPFQLPTPVRSGYQFIGWHTELSDTILQESDLLAINSPDINLLAVWAAIPYTVSYVENGGIDVPDSTYTVDQGAVLDTSVAKEGYTFLGWYDNSLFQGDAVTRLHAGETGNKVFYAKWVRTDHVITLDVNSEFTDGIAAGISETSKNVRYGESYTLPVPEIKGFRFEGWYLGSVKYADSQGQALSNYLDSDNVTLTARWTRDRYYIKIDIDGTLKWLSGNNLNAEETFVEYEQGFCPCCWMKYRVPLSQYYREGHIFENLLTVQNDITSVACWNNTDINIANGQVIELFAYYVREINNTIDFYGYSEENLPSVTASYNDKIVLPNPQKTGYTFKGWKVADYEKNQVYIGTHLAPGSAFQYGNMPDLSINRQENGCTIYLEAIFEANTYTLTLQAENSVHVVPVTFGSYITGVYVPVKPGYTFVGWRTERNGAGNAVLDGSGASIGTWNIPYDVTLYPHWQANTYTLTYYDSYSGQSFTQYVTFNHTITLRQLTRWNYHGYWMIQGEKIAMAAAYQYTYPGNLTVQSVWEGQQYDIYYKNLNNGEKTAILVEDTSYAPTTYTYGKGLDLRKIEAFFHAIPPIVSPYQFLGWYTSMSFTTKVSSISASSTGNVTLYARWQGNYGGNMRFGSLLIKNNSQFKNPYDTIGIDMTIPNRYSNLKMMGFQYLQLTIEIDIWEKDDGYQDFYLYGGTGESSRIYYNWTEEHGPGKKLTTSKTYTYNVYLSLDSIRGVDNLYLRYGAHGNWGNAWNNDNFKATLTYVTSIPKPAQ